MNISIILCTYNRDKVLANALRSIARSSMPVSIEWEVLVVDNNSNDQTRKIVGEFSTRYPNRFRYLFEPQAGKSYALNTGIQEARGDILVFTDDDVTVRATWLQNLTAQLAGKNWVGAGGRTFPEKEFTAPQWMDREDENVLAPLAVFDLGNDACDLRESPYGNNMAFRKEVFEKYGGFQTDLGPRPGCVIRNEDTEFGGRLLAAGERLRYEPSAVVYHAVLPRIRKEYFLAWWFDKARSDIRELGVPPNGGWTIVGIPLFLSRRLSVWTLRWMLTFNPARRFTYKTKVWGLLGEILECYEQPVNRGNSFKKISTKEGLTKR